MSQSIKKFIDHNRGLVAGIAVGGSVLFLSSCQSSTASPRTGNPAGYTQLNADYQLDIADAEAAINEANIKYEAAYADLEEQDRTKAAVVNILEPVLGPALASYGLGSAALLSAIGIGYDNRRKDGIIKKSK